MIASIVSTIKPALCVANVGPFGNVVQVKYCLNVVKIHVVLFKQ